MSAYRGGIGFGLRRRTEFAKATAALEPSLPELHAVYARRWGRIVGGATGLFLAIVWPFTFLLPHTQPPDEGIYYRSPDYSPSVYWMIGSFVAAILAGVVARPVARFLSRARFRTRPAPAMTGDEPLDVARLDAADPYASRARALSTLELPSVALPMITGSMFMPLVLHLLVYAVWCGLTSTSFKMNDYAAWIGMSMTIVGHAHIALAICTGLFARKLARTPSDEIEVQSRHRDWGVALGVATLVAAIPGVILLAVPPILTVITGLAFIPFMYMFARSRIQGERRALQRAQIVTRVRVDVNEVEETQDVLAQEHATLDEAELAPALRRMAM